MSTNPAETETHTHTHTHTHTDKAVPLASGMHLCHPLMHKTRMASSSPLDLIWDFKTLFSKWGPKHMRKNQWIDLYWRPAGNLEVMLANEGKPCRYRKPDQSSDPNKCTNSTNTPPSSPHFPLQLWDNGIVESPRLKDIFDHYLAEEKVSLTKTELEQLQVAKLPDREGSSSTPSLGCTQNILRQRCSSTKPHL